MSAQAYGSLTEQRYLSDVRTAGYSAADALAYGHAACDWLRMKRWGRPPGPEHVPVPLDPIPPATPVINSTERLYAHYLTYLQKGGPGRLTPAVTRRARVALLAWYDLCPFQQFVHRPVSGVND